MDCRQGNEQKFGVFPNTSLINTEIHKDIQDVLDFPDQFAEIRGVFHFCLMGSSEFNIGTFDIKEGVSSDNNKTMMVTQNLLQAFLVKGFPYVSLVEGGFAKCHDFALNFGLELENHNFNDCLICNPGGSKLFNILKKKLKIFTRQHRTGSSKYRSSSVGDAQVYELDDVDTGLYKCKLYDKATKCSSEDFYEIAINNMYFTVGVVRNYGGDSKTILYHGRLEKLYRIQSKNKNQRIVGFYFTDCPSSLVFEFQTNTDSRTCIALATKYCNLLN